MWNIILHKKCRLPEVFSCRKNEFDDRRAETDQHEGPVCQGVFGESLEVLGSAVEPGKGPSSRTRIVITKILIYWVIRV